MKLEAKISKTVALLRSLCDPHDTPDLEGALAEALNQTDLHRLTALLEQVWQGNIELCREYQREQSLSYFNRYVAGDRA